MRDFKKIMDLDIEDRLHLNREHANLYNKNAVKVLDKEDNSVR